MSKDTITYYYRGLIERGPTYKFVEGYSSTGENGGVLYPWMSAHECRAEARRADKRAVFVYPAPIGLREAFNKTMRGDE